MNLDCTPADRLRYAADHASKIADGLEQEVAELQAQLAKIEPDIGRWRAKAEEFLKAAAVLE